MKKTTYYRITSATTTTLILKESGISGSVNKILISNQDDSSSNTIQLHLDTGSRQYVIVETIMPPRTTLVLDDNLAFDSSEFSLKITTSSTADINIIIK